MTITEGARAMDVTSTGRVVARPYLQRADANIVAEAQAIRDTLHQAWLDECARRGLEANVLKSPSVTMPPWTSVEAWMPTGDSRATRRFFTSITVRPTPYHALPFEYDLTVKRGEREQRFNRMTSFSAEDARRVLGTLAEGQPLPRLRNRSVREAAWMLWRPSNKCHQVRRDWTATLALLVVLLWIFLPGLAWVSATGGKTLLLLILYGASAGLIALLARDGLLGEDTRAAGSAVLFVLALGLGLGTLLSRSPGLVLLQFVAGLTGSIAAIQALARRPQITRSVVAPDLEPRDLKLVDSWQVLIGDLGDDWNDLQLEFFSRVHNAQLPKLRHRVEKTWYHSPRGIEEREQIVLEHGRALLFVHIYHYGNDLYVGWDAHLNRGTWAEKAVARGIDRTLSTPASINSLVSGTHYNTEYDLVDANTLIEWTHYQIVHVLKHFMSLRNIDQEIDFKIQRGQRQGLAEGSGEKKDEKKSRNPLTRLGGALRRTG